MSPSKKQATERIEHLAHHDTLTGLANRNLLTERLESAVARGARYDRQFAVMWIDLDRLKTSQRHLRPRGR